jgi:hypothetical protein
MPFEKLESLAFEAFVTAFPENSRSSQAHPKNPKISDFPRESYLGNASLTT